VVTTLGTADALMHDTLCLRPDATGYVRSQSVMQGTVTAPILWRHEGSGLLGIAAPEPEDDPSQELEWETVLYTAAMTVSSVDSEVAVLTNADDTVWTKDRFWTVAGPITLVSRIPD
jgi:hypothetical protein